MVAATDTECMSAFTARSRLSVSGFRHDVELTGLASHDHRESCARAVAVPRALHAARA